MEDTLVFSSHDEWRRWLSDNHNQVSGVWLLFYKKNSCKNGMTLEEAVEEALCFGWIDSRQRSHSEETFILRFSPRKANSVWSKINKQRVERLIASGRMTKAGLAKVQEAKKSGFWDAAYSNLTLAMTPSDLKEALLREPQSWENFTKFANSYRNMYVFWINQAKTAETRQKRIKTVVDQSVKNRKLLS